MDDEEVDSDAFGPGQEYMVVNSLAAQILPPSLHTSRRSFGAATHTEGGGRPVISVVPFGVGPGWSHGKISRTGMIKRRTM